MFVFFSFLNRDIAQTCRRIIRVQFFLTILKILVQLKDFPMAEGNLFTGSLGTTARIESEKRTSCCPSRTSFDSNMLSTEMTKKRAFGNV